MRFIIIIDGDEKIKHLLMMNAEPRHQQIVIFCESKLNHYKMANHKQSGLTAVVDFKQEWLMPSFAIYNDLIYF